MARNGDTTGGLQLINECLDQIEQPGSEARVSQAEVLRLKGRMLELQGRIEEAQQTLCDAMAVAREQQAKSWELRSATTLSQLLMKREDRAEARDLLAPVYGWFTEGFDTHDLKQARMLLEALS
jgi:predicted ATPase